MVVVRSQRTILRSIYHQYLQHGGTRTLAGWLESDDYDPGRLAYDEIVGSLRRFVWVGPGAGAALRGSGGRSRRVRRPVLRLRRLGRTDRGGHPRHRQPSLARPSFWALRRVNQLSRLAGVGAATPLFPNLWAPEKNRHSPAPGPGRRQLARADVKLGPRLRQPGPADQAAIDRTADGFQENNARLEKLAGISLRRHGYPLPT